MSDENEPAQRGQNMQIPKALFRQTVDALRRTQADTRRTDRSLKDDTLSAVDDALDAVSVWQDERVFGKAAT